MTVNLDRLKLTKDAYTTISRIVQLIYLNNFHHRENLEDIWINLEVIKMQEAEKKIDEDEDRMKTLRA